MRVSYQWLNEYVNLEGVSPEELAEQLTRGGIEVELVEPRDHGVKKVVVGHVKSVEPHPDADRLRVCTVDAGQGEFLNIVCGAPNVAAGQKVPVALSGARLPGGIKIKKSKLRGVPSEGMICSAGELGLPEKLLPKEQQDGILVFSPAAEVGEDAKKLLGLDDVVLELDLTPNRSDCLSMWGIAYEVGALLDREVRLPNRRNVGREGKENLSPLYWMLRKTVPYTPLRWWKESGWVPLPNGCRIVCWQRVCVPSIMWWISPIM